jgi:hypothetical protein
MVCAIYKYVNRRWGHPARAGCADLGITKSEKFEKTGMRPMIKVSSLLFIIENI